MEKLRGENWTVTKLFWLFENFGHVIESNCCLFLNVKWILLLFFSFPSVKEGWIMTVDVTKTNKMSQHLNIYTQSVDSILHVYNVYSRPIHVSLCVTCNQLPACRWHAGDDPVQWDGETLGEDHQVPRHPDPGRLEASPLQEHRPLRPQARECPAVFWFRLPPG